MKNEIGPVVDDCAGWMFQLVVGDLGDLVGVNGVRCCVGVSFGLTFDNRTVTKPGLRF